MSFYRRKRVDDFSDSLVKFFLILFDFFDVSFIDTAGFIKAFDNLVFSVGDLFYTGSQLTEFGQIQIHSLPVNYRCANT